MTFDAFLENLFQSFEVSVCFDFPVLYLLVDCGEEWRGYSSSLEFISDRLSVDCSDVVNVLNLSSAELLVKGLDEDYEFVRSEGGENSHWLAMNSLLGENGRSRQGDNGHGCRALHFYGFKGGQARSSILGVLAKSLSEDGYRVLVVDADFEAPSLPQMFGAVVENPSSTIYGVCQLGLGLKPKSIYFSALSDGKIDLVAARPRGEDHDIGYSAFLLRSMLYFAPIKGFVESLRESARKDYDVVLFDHRTGMSFSLLPIANAWPGSMVVMSRIDSYDSTDSKINSHLFSLYPSDPGAYVSFCLDSEATENQIRINHREKINSLLDALGEAIELGAENEDEEQVSYETLSEYWVNWFYDRAFLSKAVPDLDELSVDNLKSIQNLRSCLSLSGENVASFKKNVVSSLSGASDEGVFIQTDEIAKILSPDSGVNYILGRKGTGKTRIANEIISTGKAFPVLFTSDSNVGGVKSNSSLFEYLESYFEGDYYSLWWALLFLSIKRVELGSDITREVGVDLVKSESKQFFSSFGIAEYVGSLNEPDLFEFVIDGVETATSPNRLNGFVESLMRFMSAVQTEDDISEKISIKLFIRSDLVEGALENVEQQIGGRKVVLGWDQDSIFNFFLSRVYQKDWFQTYFPSACKKIEENASLIVKGRLPQSVYLDLINDIFPKKLRRNNIQTFTFLKSYFSDSGIDSDKRATYYPRLYIYFVDSLVDLVSKDQENGIEGGRLRHDVVLDAHRSATNSFMVDVRQELSSFISIEDEREANKEAVSLLIDSFEGRQTPFDINSAAKGISRDLPYGERAIFSAIKDLERFGVFETVPKKPKLLRAGQMYKTALKMKYVRTRT